MESPCEKRHCLSSIYRESLFLLELEEDFVWYSVSAFGALFWGILHENIPKDNMQKNKNFILKILVSKSTYFL